MNSDCASATRGKALYLAHYYHSKTQSNSFLLDLLSKRFEVTHEGIDPDSASLLEKCANICLERYDLIVLFQVEFLLGIVKGLCPAAKVICVPMYDACGGAPDSYFELLRGTLVLNFSSTLHIRCTQLGINSCFWKYYPVPLIERIPGTSQDNCNQFLRIMLWVRRPSDINVEILNRLFHGYLIEHIHIHWSPDSGESLPDKIDRQLDNLCLSHSITTWFKEKNDYLSELRKCNVFIAPRNYEGIGQGFLDAMANGLAVFAHNAPTHSEYIINWHNGVLFDASSGKVDLSLSQLQSIRLRSLNFVKAGYEKQAQFRQNFSDQLDAYIANNDNANSPLLSRVYSNAAKAYENGYSGFLQYLVNSLHAKADCIAELDQTHSSTMLSTLCHRLTEDGHPGKAIDLLLSFPPLQRASVKTILGYLATAAKSARGISDEDIGPRRTMLIEFVISLVSLAHSKLKDGPELHGNTESLQMVVRILDRSLCKPVS